MESINDDELITTSDLQNIDFTPWLIDNVHHHESTHILPPPLDISHNEDFTQQCINSVKLFGS